MATLLDNDNLSTAMLAECFYAYQAMVDYTTPRRIGFKLGPYGQVSVVFFGDASQDEVDWHAINILGSNLAGAFQVVVATFARPPIGGADVGRGFDPRDEGAWRDHLFTLSHEAELGDPRCPPLGPLARLLASEVRTARADATHYSKIAKISNKTIMLTPDEADRNPLWFNDVGLAGGRADLFSVRTRSVQDDDGDPVPPQAAAGSWSARWSTDSRFADDDGEDGFASGSDTSSMDNFEWDRRPFDRSGSVNQSVESRSHSLRSAGFPGGSHQGFNGRAPSSLEYRTRVEAFQADQIRMLTGLVKELVGTVAHQGEALAKSLIELHSGSGNRVMFAHPGFAAYPGQPFAAAGGPPVPPPPPPSSGPKSRSGAELPDETTQPTGGGNWGQLMKEMLAKSKQLKKTGARVGDDGEITVVNNGTDGENDTCAELSTSEAVGGDGASATAVVAATDDVGDDNDEDRRRSLSGSMTSSISSSGSSEEGSGSATVTPATAVKEPTGGDKADFISMMTRAMGKRRAFLDPADRKVGATNDAGGDDDDGDWAVSEEW